MSPSTVSAAPCVTWASGTARSRLSAASSGPRPSAGASSRNRWIGSQTTVPACRSALVRTSGVSLR